MLLRLAVDADGEMATDLDGYRGRAHRRPRPYSLASRVAKNSPRARAARGRPGAATHRGSEVADGRAVAPGEVGPGVAHRGPVPPPAVVAVVGVPLVAVPAVH